MLLYSLRQNWDGGHCISRTLFVTGLVTPFGTANGQEIFMLGASLSVLRSNTFLVYMFCIFSSSILQYKNVTLPIQPYS